jgi:hypothetical protein
VPALALGRSNAIKIERHYQDHRIRADIEQTSAGTLYLKIAESARNPRSEAMNNGCAARDLNPEPAD